MLKNTIQADLKKVLKNLGFKGDDIVLSIPGNPDFGDYSTNVPLQLAKQKSKKAYHSPVEIANDILKEFGHPHYLERIEVAGPGFINFFVKPEVLLEKLKKPELIEKNKKKILVEYGHVNPLKEIHIGHLRTFILGECLSRVLEKLGNKVFRANYQGDIGLHIAKAIWGIRKLGLPTTQLSLTEKANFLGKAYAQGNTAYGEDEIAKKEIEDLNTKLYSNDPKIRDVYKLAIEWSLNYFTPIYKELGINYDKCFFESEIFKIGKDIVLKNLGKVFKENEGAIIFPGEEYGLHTRVFITQAGHPTYEGKELGLAKFEYSTFQYDKSIHVVASEQEGYFQVVIKAIDLIFPELRGKKYHLSYGLVDLKEGKMSSRTGNVVNFDDLASLVSERVRQVMSESRLVVDQGVVSKVAMGAIKFWYLKYSPKSNIIFDLAQSASLQGDSGPYIQYTYARTCSIFKNANLKPEQADLGLDSKELSLEDEEREIIRLLQYFEVILEETANSLNTTSLCQYLLDLAKAYNLFYQKYPIIKSEKQELRLFLTRKVGEVLKEGLNVLGIEAPERM